MTSPFYIARKLQNGDRIYHESELLTKSNFIVVLAEPGAGKTEFLKKIAEHLGVPFQTAKAFTRTNANAQNIPLVIDAFDELAKIDNAGIDALLANAQRANPTHLIISSRSSEWHDASKHAFADYFGVTPSVFYLYEFDEEEQKDIFDHYAPSEDFYAFRTEVARFDLESLLSNPQMLRLFADAYVESHRRFSDKRSIFVKAVESLAREVNPRVDPRLSSLTRDDKIALTSEVFAKLLLSGAAGISTSELAEDILNPQLASLIRPEVTVCNELLGTRLFKPGEHADHHQHVHKIVSEYCAASYLCEKIQDSSHNLTIAKCLPIIAPNGAIRDELRGMLGWMAALGNKAIQETVISLDPYAVLANGDPSQLVNSSKHLLIRQLKEVEKRDPYFRRHDRWRSFSASGFFSEAVLDEVRPILEGDVDSDLRGLMLELLEGQVPEQIHDVLLQIVLDTHETGHIRRLANECLLSVNDFDYRSYLDALITESSVDSLSLAADVLKALKPETFDIAYLAQYFQSCATLYPGRDERLQRVVGERYFVRQFIAKLDIAIIELLLDVLTINLVCTCGEQYYKCDCRNGISKIIGLMLDRYFEQVAPSYSPEKVWQWVSNLNFHDRKSFKECQSVKVLQQNNELRQGIITLVFGNLTDKEEIRDTEFEHYIRSHSHAGLIFKPEDRYFIADMAFDSDNTALWANWIPTYNYYQKGERQPDPFRRYMREQAHQKPNFMRVWAQSNRLSKEIFDIQRKQDYKYERGRKRNRRKRNENNAENLEYIKQNRELVEGGRHWAFLLHFAELTLMKPDQIIPLYREESLVRNALLNCIDFIEQYIPELEELAESKCKSKYFYAEIILYAACIVTMRVKGSLADIDPRLLVALRTNLNAGYSEVEAEEQDRLQVEVDRLIFNDNDSRERFLREYLEPQLAAPNCSHPEIWLLQGDEAFSELREYLSIEWLAVYTSVNLHTLDTLFDIAIKYGNRERLIEIIVQRCSEIMTRWPESTGDEEIENKRKFWLVRAWYFLSDTPEEYWDWLASDKENVFMLDEVSGRMNRKEHWPILTSLKVEKVLDAFVDEWPKVDLPSHWGSGSPKEETAYRFLTNIIWSIHEDASVEAISVINRLLADFRFVHFHKELQGIHVDLIRKQSFFDFEPPTPDEIVQILDNNQVATVEGLRQLVIDELIELQKAIDGGEFNTGDSFYAYGQRLGEVRSAEIIAERLSLRLAPQNITITPEHHLQHNNRCDFTVAKLINGQRRLLVTEVKGQWHRDLFSAAVEQLNNLYSIHPEAEQQGIYLVLWFGADELIAGRTTLGMQTAQELKSEIEAELPAELAGRIDVFVLDVSR